MFLTVRYETQMVQDDAGWFLYVPRYSQTTCHAKYHPIVPHIQCVQRAKVENADNADRTQWPQLKIFHLSRPSQTLCLDRNVSPSFTDKSPFRCFGSSDVSNHHQLGCKDSRSANFFIRHIQASRSDPKNSCDLVFTTSVCSLHQQ